MLNIPSYLSFANPSALQDHGLYSNFSLRFGEVKEIIYPDSKASISKRTIEYNVAVQHKDLRLNTGYVRTYNNCILFNLFAGKADKCVYTLRADTQNGNTKEGLGVGSKVLLLCINAEQMQAVIIGGLRDANDLDEEKNKAKELGHHFQLLFNGIEYLVNKEGELSLTYQGKSKVDGTPEDDVDTNAIGTKFQMTKKGDIRLTTKDSQEEVLLDHENKKIILKAQQGTKIGAATDSLLLGSTYRQSQTVFHNQLIAAFQQLQQEFTVVAISLQTAGAAMVTPITGAVAAAPAVSAAAVALNLIISAMAQIITAINSFEGQSQQYLSKNNQTD